MINSVGKNNVILHTEEDKQEVLDKLKSSLDTLNVSPRIKLNNNNLNNSDKLSISERLIFDEVLNGKGRKHLVNHPNYIDNVTFDYKDFYTSPNQRYEELVNHYTKMGEQERNYKYNPLMHSFYKKEQLDPLIRNSKKLRYLYLSPDNSNIRSNIKNEYQVLKFNQNTSSNVIGNFSDPSKIKIINQNPTKIIYQKNSGRNILKNVYSGLKKK